MKKKVRNPLVYAVSISKCLYDFSKPLKNAALKLKLELELSGVSNPTNHDTMMCIHIIFNLITTECKAYWAVSGPLMGSLEGA
jgi:hypothetical protein